MYIIIKMEEDIMQIKQVIKEQPKIYEQTYRFRFKDTDLWKNHLKNQGFVVIANWLFDQQCQKYVDQFWDIMEKLSRGRLDRNDLSTQILGKNYPPVLHGGMIQYIAHSQPQWQLRGLCKPIFQTLWDCEQVTTSFDGFCFMNGRRNYKKTQDNSFLHTDQSPTKDYIWSYQGIMTLTDAGPDGGGFVAVPKTHLYHHQYFKQKKMLNYKDNWYMFPQADKIKQPICNQIKVNTKAGDFILFDSRTFHCNSKPKTQTLRICTYVCMIPSDKITKKSKEARKKGLEARRTSNHHPGDGFKTFPSLPRYLEDPNQFKQLIKEVNDFKFENFEEYRKII